MATHDASASAAAAAAGAEGRMCACGRRHAARHQPPAQRQAECGRDRPTAQACARGGGAVQAIQQGSRPSAAGKGAWVCCALIGAPRHAAHTDLSLLLPRAAAPPAVDAQPADCWPAAPWHPCCQLASKAADHRAAGHRCGECVVACHAASPGALLRPRGTLGRARHATSTTCPATTCATGAVCCGRGPAAVPALPARGGVPLL